MPRHIDADMFLKSVKQKAYPQSGSVNESERKISLFGIMEILTAMPTADVVEVVRCKDCRFSEPVKESDGSFYNCVTGLGVGANHFCSIGERREDAEIH